MPSTPLSLLPYPTLTSSNNPPADIGALATALDPLVSPQIQTWPVGWTQFGGTALSIGNGTLVGQWVRVGAGRLIAFNIALTRGSTTNVGTASYLFSLPFPAAALMSPGTGIVTAGGNPTAYVMRMPNSSQVAAIRTKDDSALGNSSFTWATGDTIVLSGFYFPSS